MTGIDLTPDLIRNGDCLNDDQDFTLFYSKDTSNLQVIIQYVSEI